MFVARCRLLAHQSVCYVDGMRPVRASSIRRLRTLKNISWLTAPQLEKLSNALTVSTVEKRAIIFDEEHSPDSAYILLAGVARITCRNRKGQRSEERRVGKERRS